MGKCVHFWVATLFMAIKERRFLVQIQKELKFQLIFHLHCSTIVSLNEDLRNLNFTMLVWHHLKLCLCSLFHIWTNWKVLRCALKRNLQEGIFLCKEIRQSTGFSLEAPIMASLPKYKQDRCGSSALLYWNALVSSAIQLQPISVLQVSVEHFPNRLLFTIQKKNYHFLTLAIAGWGWRGGEILCKQVWAGYVHIRYSFMDYFLWNFSWPFFAREPRYSWKHVVLQKAGYLSLLFLGTSFRWKPESDNNICKGN